MNQKKPKKVISIDEFLAKYQGKKIPITQKELYAEKYKTSIAQARADYNDEKTIGKLNLRTGYYSLRTKIINNPWVKSRPSSQAARWMFKEVFTNPGTYKYNKLLLLQGSLFMWEYLNPKYKGTKQLPWFDKYPLVLSLGPVVTNEGVRNIGFNLHLLPPKIRIIVLCGIFEIYKRLYRYQIFYKIEKPVQVNYRRIVEFLSRYGVEFCIRMYIPSRMKQIVKFPIRDWHIAIFISSRGYDSIKAAQLTREWQNYCRDKGLSGVHNLDWKSLI